MAKKSTPQKSTAVIPLTASPTNAKKCEHCGSVNSFKRVKCEQCGTILPEGKFERSRRMREQSLRRERQLALSSTLFRDKPLIPDDSDDTGDSESSGPGAGRKETKAPAVKGANKRTA